MHLNATMYSSHKNKVDTKLLAPLLIMSRDLPKSPPIPLHSSLKPIRPRDKIKLRPRPFCGEHYYTPVGKIARNLSLPHEDSYTGELQNKLIEKYSSECQTLRIEIPVNSFIEKDNSIATQHCKITTAVPPPENSLEDTPTLVISKLSRKKDSSAKTPIRELNKTKISFPALTQNTTPTKGKGNIPPIHPFYAKRYFASVKKERRFPSPKSYRVSNRFLAKNPLEGIRLKRKVAKNPVIVRSVRKVIPLADLSLLYH